MSSAPIGEKSTLRHFRALLDKARGGLERLGDAELLELVRLYRFSASRIALHETTGGDPAALEDARQTVARAHALLYRDIDRPREGFFERALRFYLLEVPQAIAGEWKILAASFAMVYGLALISFFAVRRDLELAYSLMDPGAVTSEIQQLERTKPGEPFRGNFTFGVGQSPVTAGRIMTHNMSVGILFFAAGLVPPLFVKWIATNGLMLGVYTAVAGHWNQAWEISSILWCHGTLELQAIVLAGAAGLILLRAWIAPGPWSRRHAMRLESARAWRLMAAVFPMLFCAGLIEGFVSPHAPLPVRMMTAALTGAAMIAWILLGVRSQRTRALR